MTIITTTCPACGSGACARTGAPYCRTLNVLRPASDTSAVVITNPVRPMAVNDTIEPARRAARARRPAPTT